MQGGRGKVEGAEKVDAIVAFVEGSMGLENSLTAEPASGQHHIHQIIHKLSTYYVEFFCPPYYYFSKVHDK